MATILSIETSTSVCSAALHEGWKIVRRKRIACTTISTSRLAILINEIFLSTNISKQAVDAIAVSSGPGSYTGLRIGVATAKGLCYGLNIPLLAIDLF